jgi:SAM-dependent methyltransferase
MNVQSSHCYGDFEAFLSEVNRVLRPGGTLAYADAWDLEMFPLDWNARRKQVQESGLRVIAQSEVGAEVSVAMQSGDGFGPVFLEAVSGMDNHLLLAVTAGLERIQSALAEHRATYWIYKLVKPFSQELRQ